MWRRGTSEAGGQCTLCSSAVSMDSVGSSRFEEASLYGNVNNEKQTEQIRAGRKIVSYFSSAKALRAGLTERIP